MHELHLIECQNGIQYILIKCVCLHLVNADSLNTFEIHILTLDENVAFHFGLVCNIFIFILSLNFSEYFTFSFFFFEFVCLLSFF